MRFQVLADVLEECAVLFGRREISRALADKLSKLSRNSTTKVRVVWQFLNGLRLQKLAHGNNSAHKFIRVDFSLARQLANPEHFLTEIVVDSHSDVLQATLCISLFLLDQF